MDSNWKKKQLHQRQLSQLRESLDDFVIGINTNAGANGNESLEPHTNSLSTNFGRLIISENSACQDQIITEHNDNKIRKAVENAVPTVENRVHDAISTAMDNLIQPQVEMAVRALTGSSGRGPSGEVQNPDLEDFTGKTENTPLISASSLVDLNNDQGRNDATRIVDYIGDGNFWSWDPILTVMHTLITWRHGIIPTKQ